MYIHSYLDGYTGELPDIDYNTYRLSHYKERTPFDSDVIEYWAQVPDVAIHDIIHERYYISTFGNTYNANTHKSFGLSMHKKGYLQFSGFSTTNGKAITRKIHIVLMRTFAYFPGCEEYEVNHIDGNKLNNKITNLEWCTSSENTIHAIQHGLKTVFGNSYNVELTDEQALEIIKLHKSGVPPIMIKQIMNIPVSEELISNIGTGKCRMVAQRMYKAGL